MKKIISFISFILILGSWYLGEIFTKGNFSFFNDIKLPSYTPNPIVFSVTWTILYVLISISIFMIYSEYKFDKNTKNYYKALLTNYVFNQLFSFCFFTLRSPFLGFVTTIIVFLTSINLYIETSSLNKKAANYLIPYMLWTLFASILATNIYIINS